MPLSTLAEWLAIHSPVSAPASSTIAPYPSPGSAVPFVAKPSLAKSAVAKNPAVKAAANSHPALSATQTAENAYVTSMRKRLPVWIALLVVIGTTLAFYIHRNLSRSIEIEVFVVTKGSQNIKLGLVEVSATELKTAKAYLTPVCEEKSAKMRITKKSLAESEENLSQTQQERQDLEKNRESKRLAAFNSQEKYTDVHKRTSEALKSSLEPLRVQLRQLNSASSSPATVDVNEKMRAFDRDIAIDELYPHAGWDDESEIISEIGKFREILGREVWKGIPPARNALLTELSQYESATRTLFAAEGKVEKIKKDENELTTLVAINRASVDLAGNFDSVFDNLPQAQAVAKTNAEGKCTLTLPKGGNWVVTARSRRTVTNDNEETYDWLVQIPQNATHIMLSNDNVLNPLEDPLARLK